MIGSKIEIGVFPLALVFVLGGCASTIETPQSVTPSAPKRHQLYLNDTLLREHGADFAAIYHDWLVEPSVWGAGDKPAIIPQKVNLGTRPTRVLLNEARRKRAKTLDDLVHNGIFRFCQENQGSLKVIKQQYGHQYDCVLGDSATYYRLKTSRMADSTLDVVYRDKNNDALQERYQEMIANNGPTGTLVYADVYKDRADALMQGLEQELGGTQSPSAVTPPEVHDPTDFQFNPPAVQMDILRVGGLASMVPMLFHTRDPARPILFLDEVAHIQLQKGREDWIISARDGAEWPMPKDGTKCLDAQGQISSCTITVVVRDPGNGESFVTRPWSAGVPFSITFDPPEQWQHKANSQIKTQLQLLSPEKVAFVLAGMQSAAFAEGQEAKNTGLFDIPDNPQVISRAKYALINWFSNYNCPSNRSLNARDALIDLNQPIMCHLIKKDIEAMERGVIPHPRETPFYTRAYVHVLKQEFRKSGAPTH